MKRTPSHLGPPIRNRMDRVEAYIIPFREYQKTPSSELAEIYRKFIVLGVFEYIRDGCVILIARDSSKGKEINILPAR